MGSGLRRFETWQRTDVLTGGSLYWNYSANGAPWARSVSHLKLSPLHSQSWEIPDLTVTPFPVHRARSVSWPLARSRQLISWLHINSDVTLVTHTMATLRVASSQRHRRGTTLTRGVRAAVCGPHTTLHDTMQQQLARQTQHIARSQNKKNVGRSTSKCGDNIKIDPWKQD